MTLFEKLRTFTLSNLHSLLDSAIDLNSVEAIKQHVRDLEDAHRSLLQALAGAKGNESALTTQITAVEARIADLTAKIELLLGDEDVTNDHFADPFGEQIGDCEGELDALREELTAAQAEVTALAKAEGQLKSRVGEMHTQLRKLSSLERTAEAKERAASAISSAAGALSSGADATVDSVTNRLRQRAGTADASFDQAVDGLDGAGGAEAAVRKAQGAGRVAEIRARLAAQRATAP